MSEGHLDRLHGYYLEDLKPGMSAVFAKTVTEADIVLFAGVSGDTVKNGSRVLSSVVAIGPAFIRNRSFSRVSSGFGRRIHPIFKSSRAHTGTDFAAPTGTRVLAAADGHVISAGWRGGSGPSP